MKYTYKLIQKKTEKWEKRKQYMRKQKIKNKMIDLN